jgi:hypothetical protein
MPRISIEGAVGIAMGVLLLILDKMGIGGLPVYVALFAVAAILCLDSVIRSEWATSDRSRQAARRFGGGAIVCVVFVVLGIWIFRFHVLKPEATTTEQRPKPQPASDEASVMLGVIRGWDSSRKGCRTQIDSTELHKFASDYYLYVACGIDDPTVDKLQETRIAISNPFSIQGTQEIDISWSDSIRARFRVNRTRIFHVAFLLPKEVNVAEIKKLQDIESHHGKLIPIGKRDVSVRTTPQTASEPSTGAGSPTPGPATSGAKVINNFLAGPRPIFTGKATDTMMIDNDFYQSAPDLPNAQRTLMENNRMTGTPSTNITIGGKDTTFRNNTVAGDNFTVTETAKRTLIHDNLFQSQVLINSISNDQKNVREREAWVQTTQGCI